MVSLFMGQLDWQGAPPSEEVVRRTAVPYYADKPAAEMDDQPVQQEYESDSDPELGMNTRQLASAWHEGQRGTPFWIGRVDDVTASQARINDQVSSSGTAAQREASGIVAPNASYAIGIEPVADLNGAAFGNEYFVRDQREIQDGMGDMMTVPPGYDKQTMAEVNARGKEAARDAAQASLYSRFWSGPNA